METHSSPLIALPRDHPMNHEIFLSHSGKQKGFVKDLCRRLETQGYSVFFDQNHDSLPPGEDFPPLIMSAANTCKLALIVISDDFLSSKWPMLELCLLADRLSLQSNHRSDHSLDVQSNHRSDHSLDVPPSAPPLTILPLFFELCPADIKDNTNVRKWRDIWIGFEKKDGRMSAVKCEEAATKMLPHLSGIVRGPKSEQGEASYIEEVVDGIFSILHPRNMVGLRYGANLNKHYVGVERLCKLILDKFSKLEEDQQQSTKIAFLGMYGIGGSGKSTICDFLRISISEEFRGKAIHLSLPTELRANDAPEVKEQYVKLLSMLIPYKKRDFALMDLEQLYNQLHFGATSGQKMFVVVDNISPSNYDIYETMIQAILSSNVLGHGSRIMVVAQSRDIIKKLFMEFKYNHAITEVPCLTEEEATQVIRNGFPSIKDDLVTHLLHKCTFSFMYIPFVFEQIGTLLRKRRCNDLKELEQFWKIVEEGKMNAVKKLVEMNFRQMQEDLKGLFFDIALFIIPAMYSKLRDAIPILCRMHNITEAIELEWKIADLQRHCTLSITGEELRMHDIFIEYAQSIPEISKFYVNEPSLNISNILDVNDHYMHPRRITLKFPVARTICIGTCKGSIDCQHNATAPQIAYDEEVCLHVEVGGTTRALVVRNKSEYSRCILVLSGDLTSLLCLQTEKVHQVAFWSSTSGEGDVNLSSFVRLELRNENIEDVRRKSFSGLKRKRSSFMDLVSHKIQKSIESMTWLWKPLGRKENYLPRSSDQRMSNFVFLTRQMTYLRQMTCLRVLVLINVDIGRLEIVGSYYPVLEVLEIRNKLQDLMDVSIHRTSQLKRLVVGCATRISYYEYSHALSRSPFSRNARRLVLGLGDCPVLEELNLDGSFDRVEVVGLLSKKLRVLAMASDRSEEFIPTKLIGSSFHQLSALEELELSWGSKGINNLAFTQKCFGCLPALKKIIFDGCESLARLTLEPSCVPNLQVLRVSFCEKLQVLEGLEHIIWMEQMRNLYLSLLPQLEVECDLSGGLKLESINIFQCPGVKISFYAYKHSQPIDYSFEAGGINIAPKLKQYDVALKEDGTSAMKEEDGASMLVDNSKCCSNVEESTIVASSSTWLSSSSSATPAAAVHRLTFASLRTLQLFGIDHLQEIKGIHHLPNLYSLSLGWLPNLTRVSGTQWPTSIQWIEFHNCPMLLEIPPFEQTLPDFSKLHCDRCTALKAVEGCSFGEMKGLRDVRFTECSMEVFPMEQSMEVMGDDKQWWRKKREEYPEKTWNKRLSVYGSKFARREVVERWLRVSEFGSPLFEAAVEALLWEHIRKGGALDALHDYFSALFDTISHANDLRYLYNLFFAIDASETLFFPFGFKLSWKQDKWIKKKEVELFQEWMLRKFPQLSHFT